MYLPYTCQTVTDCIAGASGDVEIICGLEVHNGAATGGDERGWGEALTVYTCCSLGHVPSVGVIGEHEEQQDELTLDMGARTSIG